MEAIIRCEDLLGELAEREKKESANSLSVSSHGLTDRILSSNDCAQSLFTVRLQFGRKKPTFE